MLNIFRQIFDLFFVFLQLQELLFREKKWTTTIILLQLSFLDIVCEGSEVARQGNELAHHGRVIACRLFVAIG